MSFEREIENREFDKLQRFRAEKAARDKLDGGSAFPSHGSMGEVEHRGMSLRDWLAGKVLAGCIANPGTTFTPEYNSDLARLVYGIADAMLAERAKQEPKP